MASDAEEAPGRSGKPSASLASSNILVAPGETPKVAPASLAALTSAGVSSVPAPTMPPGTSAMARITSRAAGVRRVTSSAGKPPATRASASGLAWATSSTTSTGTIGAALQISRALTLADWGVMDICFTLQKWRRQLWPRLPRCGRRQKALGLFRVDRTRGRRWLGRGSQNPPPELRVYLLLRRRVRYLRRAASRSGRHPALPGRHVWPQGFSRRRLTCARRSQKLPSILFPALWTSMASSYATLACRWP
mmetsp:Transcript_22913/g.38482  ORF Transcript_22913/g.38482 Transcript_22913/m.38482 type:complete len:250 (+) Transcript_22913:670-1419(+)